MMDGVEEEDEDEEASDDHFRDSMMARKRKVKMESSAGVVTSSSLPDVVESIGLPNVVHVMNVASVKFNHQQCDPGVSAKMSDQQNGSQGVLHVDGNSHRSSVVRNIPITILEEASEEEDEEEVDKVTMVVKDSEVNQGHNNNKEYQWTNGITTIRDAQQELKSEGFGCDK